MKQDTPKNFQIQSRLKTISSPNDKLVRNVFNLPAAEFADVIRNGEDVKITEKIIRGKKIQTRFELEIIGLLEKEKIPAYFEIDGIGAVNLSRPLNEYDRAVLDVCISARKAGHEVITVDFLFREITQNKRRSPQPAQKAAILESIGKMMTTFITIDFSATRKEMKKYSSAPPRLFGAILPCKYLDNVTVNGRSTAVIKFLDESPLMTIARAKKQVITYPVALLNVPNQNNTPLVTKIKSHLIRRVKEIKEHKELKRSITFTCIFEKCGLADADKGKRRDARKVILSVMEHLKSQGEIRDFEFSRNGGAYYGITITL